MVATYFLVHHGSFGLVALWSFPFWDIDGGEMTVVAVGCLELPMDCW